MSTGRLSVQQNIANIIKRFKFDELESSVMTHFPEILWTDVRAALMKHRKTFTSSNVAHLFKVFISEAKIEPKELTDRLPTLQLIDTSWHSKKKLWYGYTFTNSNKSSSHLTSNQIQSNMQDYFDSLNMTIDIRINVHNDITYISLIEKKSKSRKRKIQYNNIRPIYVALFIGQKYFFSNKKYLSSDILNAISRSMGFHNSKRLRLMGRDLSSLIQLCWNKNERAMNCENVTKDLIYVENEPEIRDTGINFTQQTARENYTKRCFSDDPPTLEALIIKGISAPFSHEYMSTKLSNEEIRATWEFRSHNIANFLSNLIERRVLVTPVPNYISNLMTLGKNELTLQKVND